MTRQAKTCRVFLSLNPAVQPGGKVVAAGAGTVGDNVDLAVARRNADGTPDPSFSADGKVNSNFVSAMAQGRDVALQSDEKRVAGRVHQQWQRHRIRRGALPRGRGAFHGRHAERIEGQRQYQGRDRALALTPDFVSATMTTKPRFPTPPPTPV